MKRCVHSLEENPTWEHAWLYAGKRINDAWAIVPAAKRFNNDATGRVKSWSRLVALFRADLDDILKKYPRRDWVQEGEKLKSMFPDWHGKIIRIGLSHFIHTIHHWASDDDIEKISAIVQKNFPNQEAND